MIAIEGRTYAQIQNGICWWIFTSAELPEWNNDDCPAVDVTDNVPNVGDTWDGQAFSAQSVLVEQATPQVRQAIVDPVQKLVAYLNANPDVAALLK